MNTRLWLPVVALSASLVAATVAFGPAVGQDKEAKGKADAQVPVVKWEYKVIHAESEGRAISAPKTEAAINKLGQDGWECVGTVSEVTGTTTQGSWTTGVLILKRPVR